MSERTTIGGTVYEAIGSSSSNLLLKCNGTARILWGSKLIDLIKNGKIASEDSLELIFIISDKSEIKSDGVYVLTTEESNQLWVCKDGNLYDLTGTDLYISASKELNLTVEQKKQALDNIGVYYETLEEVKKSGLQTGIVYVIENKTLYTILNGQIEEFEAKLKTVTVDQESEEGVKTINSSIKIVLSILDEEYLVLTDLRITANYSIHVKDSALLGSENADKNLGYRLYIDGGVSYLDVDEINIRNGLHIEQYKEVTFEQLLYLMNGNQLKTHFWYLITDYLNYWKLTGGNRPILVRALTENSLYEDGFLFSNHKIRIKYDPSYQELINYGENIQMSAKGKITWMKDLFNNEATFDFLDYIDSNENPLTLLHNGSIFPIGSYNNKLIVSNLKGITIKNNIIDNTDTYIIEFSESIKNMHDNSMEVKNLIVDCENFYNNTFTDISNLEIKADCYNNLLNNVNNIQISLEIRNCKINSLTDSTINSILADCTFQTINDCTFAEGSIENVTSYCDLISINFNLEQYNLLYNVLKPKEIYKILDKIEVLCIPDVVFYRGMIIMHSGIEEIPPGWAPCDGGTYEWEGKQYQTPDLKDKFIKAVGTAGEIGDGETNTDLNEDGKLILKKDLLPEHNHPHKEHTHTISDIEGDVKYSGDLNLTSSSTFAWNTYDTTVLTGVDGVEELTESTAEVVGSVEWRNVESTGGSHTHDITISGGKVENTKSEEETLTWENNPINIEPKHYKLIFIMKL